MREFTLGLCFLASAILIVAGVWILSEAAALIVAGALLAGLGYLFFGEVE